jgi:hypothetical protein
VVALGLASLVNAKADQRVPSALNVSPTGPPTSALVK